jgi:hypothetical protein
MDFEQAVEYALEKGEHGAALSQGISILGVNDSLTE